MEDSGGGVSARRPARAPEAQAGEARSLACPVSCRPSSKGSSLVRRRGRRGTVAPGRRCAATLSPGALGATARAPANTSASPLSLAAVARPVCSRPVLHPWPASLAAVARSPCRLAPPLLLPATCRLPPSRGPVARRRRVVGTAAVPSPLAALRHPSGGRAVEAGPPSCVTQRTDKYTLTEFPGPSHWNCVAEVNKPQF